MTDDEWNIFIQIVNSPQRTTIEVNQPLYCYQGLWLQLNVELGQQQQNILELQFGDIQIVIESKN